MREEGLSDPHSVGQVVSQWLGVACLVSFIHPPIHSLSVHPDLSLSSFTLGPRPRARPPAALTPPDSHQERHPFLHLKSSTWRVF